MGANTEMYTPEYSDELLALITELYKDELRPYINDLKLSKMIELIEVAEYNLEQYTQALDQGLHIKCLKNFIVGLFYIYLVIPNSIQFQFKNKNYELFLSLKQLYEKETNMSNVKLQVTNYIGYLNDKSQPNKNITRAKSKRSNTLPSSSLQQDLSQYLKPPSSNDQHNTDNLSVSPVPSSNCSVSSFASTNSSVVDDLWLPPELKPNDQLRLANDNESADILPPGLPSEPAPPIPKIHHAKSFPNNNTAPSSNTPELLPSSDDEPNTTLEYFHTKASHRKDSYHSVYVEESNEHIKLLDSKTLFGILSDGQVTCLLVDIRSGKHFQVNHIPYENIINIDPSLITGSRDFQELEDIVKNSCLRDEFQRFRNLKKYDLVLFYTDDKTFMASQDDYMTKFAAIMTERSIETRSLSGGFDSWLKYLSKHHQSNSVLRFPVKPLLAAPQLPSVPPPLIPSSVIQEGKISPKSMEPDGNNYQRSINQLYYNPNTNHHNPPPVPPPHSSISQQSSQVQSSSRPYPTQMYYQETTPVYAYNGYSSEQTQSYHRPPAQIPPTYIPPASAPSSYYHAANTQYQSSKKNTARDLQRQRINSSSIPTIQRNPNIFVRLSITGLRNMGNTCYINSMIQCLFASTSFREIFLDNKFEEYYNLNFKKPRLSPSLSLLFKKMFLNGACSIVPSGFLKTCVQLRPDLRIPSEQQDTQEFLMFLLDQLHDELSNSNAVVSDYPELVNHENIDSEYDKWFEGLFKQGFSPISKIFQGQLQDSVQCMNCGFKSSNYSTFYMLSLVIPKLSPINGKKLKKVNLEDCIKLFTDDEIMTGENAWDCPKCSKKKSVASVESSSSAAAKEVKEKEPRKHRLHFTNGFKFRGRSSSPAPSRVKKSKDSHSGGGSGNTTKKSLKFVSLPPVLIIHLSRFLFYDESQKDDAIVQYPLILEIPHNGSIVSYKLFGVVNHFGTLKSGHYTAITNKSLDHNLTRPDWYYFDDETVKSTNHGSYNGKDQTHMSSSEVYVLFYEKVE